MLYGVATRSANLKGTYVKALKEVSMVVHVGSDVLSVRFRGTAEQYELERLRGEIQNLKKEVEELRKAKSAEVPQPGVKQSASSIFTVTGDARTISEGNMSLDEQDFQENPTRWELPLEEEWPAIRPAIQGKRKVL